MEQIVDSFNLFVDSSRSNQPGSTGDNFKLSLANDIIEAGKGQMIRVSLTDFAMEKPMTDINQHNNYGKINIGTHIIQFGGLRPAPIPANYFYNDGGLDHINLPNLTELATVFGDALKTAYDAFTDSRAEPAAAHLTVDSATVGKDNRIILVIKFTNVANTPANFNIQLNSDLHLLLGGTYSDTTFDSLTVTKLATNDGFTIESKYPAARHSQHHIYLRTTLSNTGIETAGFGSPDHDPQMDTDHSSILGRIPLQDEVIFYEASHGREYFLNLRQKNISHMRLYLTDEHSRPLPLFAGQNAQKGTCRFTATLRIDIIQVMQPNTFQTPPYESGIPPRFTSNFLEKLDFGAPMKTFQ